MLLFKREIWGQIRDFQPHFYNKKTFKKSRRWVCSISGVSHVWGTVFIQYIMVEFNVNGKGALITQTQLKLGQHIAKDDNTIWLVKFN